MADDAPKPNLDDLLAKARAEIDQLDASILELLAARRRTVDEVAAVKKEHNLAVYHPAREENLIYSRRKDASQLGLDPDVVEDIFRTILHSSRVTQNQSLKGRSLMPGAAIVIVGGRGAMGRDLAGWFSGAGYEVRILDAGDWASAETLCRGARLVLLSVPIEVTEESAFLIAKHLDPGCVLADITSVKERPLKAMLAAHPGPVVGLHPMFGPGASTFDKQIVVRTPGRADAQCQWVVDQLAAWGAVVVTADAAEHDRVMDVVQGLRHFATFAFGQFLYHRGIDLARTLEFSSPIYRLELDMVGRLFAQDPALYGKIIFSTPERRELLKGYLESVGRNLALLESGDEKAFLEEFSRIALWFGPFSDQAIRESGYLIDKMVERF